MAPLIEIENLGKRYLIRHQGNQENAFQYRSLRDELPRRLRQLVGRGKRTPKVSTESFWALSDVSFQVQQGESIGIIGRNGAGKSTLLKILSRITEPTRGRVTLRGRVASLLEVGTGFHPELTGRENIFLNGAILGMTRAEIRARFDEIVAFAEVERFLDTPVKRFSSGMYVRLAFAVAAHIDPEILIVDEVLAVGDADFQKKCLGRMEAVANEGRTVLFVSHNMGSISSLCRRTLLLESGKVVSDGSPSEVIPSYYRRGQSAPHEVDFMGDGRSIGSLGGRLLTARITDRTGASIPDISIEDSFHIRMLYRLTGESKGTPYPNFHLFDSAGNYVCVVSPSGQPLPGSPGVYEAICEFPGWLLNDGTYFVGLALTYSENGIQVAFFERDALIFHISDPIEKTLHSSRNGYAGPIPGAVRPLLNWQILPHP